MMLRALARSFGGGIAPRFQRTKPVRTYAIVNRIQKFKDEHKPKREERVIPAREHAHDTEDTPFPSSGTVGTKMNDDGEEEFEYVDADEEEYYRDSPPGVEEMLTPMIDANSPEDALSLRVAIIGAPSSGKSTLVNAIIGKKVSVVSPKAQTTREQIRGILTRDNVQIVFLDTPGIVQFQGQKSIQRSLITSVADSVEDADVVLFAVDCREWPTCPRYLEYTGILKEWKASGRLCPVHLVLTKIDLLHPRELAISQAEQLAESFDYDQIYYTSGLKDEKLEILLESLSKQALPRPWEYHSDQTEDQSLVKITQERIREQIYNFTNQEIPYLTEMNIWGWTPFADGSLKIECDIFVPKKNQKKTLVGKGGHMIKRISIRARLELEKALGRKVHLYLYIKQGRMSGAQH